MESFKYLYSVGTEINKNNNNTKKVHHNISLYEHNILDTYYISIENKCYFGLQKGFRSKLLLNKSKKID